MRLFCIALASAIVLSSCHYFMGKRVSGNGHITSRQESVGTFNSVDVSGSVKVHVRQDATASVKIETDENLMQYIEVYTSGNTVVIRTKQGFNLDPSKDVIAYITAPSFRDIEVSGACDIIGDEPIDGNEELSMHISGDGDINMQVDLPKVSTEISGSGSVNLKGQVSEFSAEVSGNGDVRCFDLMTEHTTLDLSGAANAEVNASKTLNVEVSGAGDVRYRGNASVNQKISGAGSVKKEG